MVTHKHGNGEMLLISAENGRLLMYGKGAGDSFLLGSRKHAIVGKVFRKIIEEAFGDPGAPDR